MEDVVASQFAVGIYFQEVINLKDLQIAELLDEGLSEISVEKARAYIVPVCYERGPDLEDAASILGLSGAELIDFHTSLAVTCFAVGFCPGFGYCQGLPSPIVGLPRLPTPRKRVEAGMVGLTGEMTAVYPLKRPGGWRLIGQTPLVMCDPDSDFFPIQAGDRLKFEPIGESEFHSLKGRRLGEDY